MATPTVLMLDPDGSEVDWIVGYGPPPEEYQETVDRSLKGIETYQFYSESYANDPENVETVFNLGMKWSRRYQRDKAAEFFGKVLELDPDGSKGTTEYQGEEVSFAQYADFNLAANALGTRPPDPSPLLTFVEKYPEGVLVRAGYDRLSSYFLRMASQESAAVFFEKYASRYSDDPRVLGAWIQRITRDQGPFDKGVELSQKALSLMADSPQPRIVLDIASLYILKGDADKAVELAEMAVKNGGAASSSVTSSAASIFLRAEAVDKAVAAYGPEFAKSNWDNAAVLSRYASFWSREPDSNGTSALAAAIRAVDLSSDSYSYWSTLSDVFFSQKRFDDALLAARKALDLAPAGRAKEFVEKKIEQIKKASEKT